MARIFISYKRVDQRKVFELKNKIEEHTGEKCWIDFDGIESDAQFKNVIIKAINQCEIVLFMYSNAHSKITDFEKDWTVRELNFASNKNKRIVFINLDGSPLTDEFAFDYSTKQQVDGESSEAISRLISDLNKWLGKSDSETDKSKELIIPKDGGVTVLVDSGEDIIQRIYDKGKEVSSVKLPKKDHRNNRKWYKKNQKLIYVFLGFCLLTVTVFIILRSCVHSNQVHISQSEESEEPEIVEIWEAVDLGLPSGTLWSNVNIGANLHSDYGNLFAWGDSTIKATYTPANYRSPQINTLSGSEYDLNEEWSIPSESDFNELIEHCNWTWILEEGHYGYKIEGRNGNYIFLPAGGWSHDGNNEYRDFYGYYWTSDKVNDTFAKGLLFSKSEKRTGNGYLYYGRSVRPVLKN